MALLFVLLLIISLAGFFAFGNFDVKVLGASMSDFGMSGATMQFLFGIAVVFCELAIIGFSMLGRIGDTIRDVIKPLARLIPLGMFLVSVWRTYAPLIFSLLPPAIGELFGYSNAASFSIAQSIEDGSFTEGVLLTLVTMLFFVVMTYALGRQRESAEVRRLRAEVARYKKLLS